MSSEKPLVSVHMITYNHEKFIAQAIEGVLMQKTSFPFELVIGEDCSTDRTRKIVVDYANRYPEIIKPILHEKNVGAKANSESVGEACTGKYVALCEGDDYWIDPLKLQKQVDFLDSNPGFSVCFHRARIVDKFGNCLGISKPSMKWHRPITNLRDVLKSNYIPTQSVLYRNRGYNWEVFDTLSNGLYFGDWPLHVLNAERGDIYFINEFMSAYRLHDGGSNRSASDIRKVRDNIEFYKRLQVYFQGRIPKSFFEKCKANLLANTATTLALKGNRGLAKEVAHYALASCRHYSPRFLGRIAKAYVAILCPFLSSMRSIKKRFH